MGAKIAITWYSTFVCLRRESEIHRYWHVVSAVSAWSKVAASVDAHCRGDCHRGKTDDDPRVLMGRYFFRQTRCVERLSTGYLTAAATEQHHQAHWWPGSTVTFQWRHADETSASDCGFLVKNFIEISAFVNYCCSCSFLSTVILFVYR